MRILFILLTFTGGSGLIIYLILTVIIPDSEEKKVKGKGIKQVISETQEKTQNLAEEIKEALIMQLTSPVKWTQSVIQMQIDGISEFIELGPGNVLQGLIKRAIKDVEIKGADKLVDLEKFI